MKKAFVEKTDDGPNPWENWRLVMIRKDGNFENTVIRYFANEYDAEEERKKFLDRTQTPHNNIPPLYKRSNKP